MLRVSVYYAEDLKLNMSPYCQPNSEWVPSGKTGEIMAVKIGTGYPTTVQDNIPL